MNPIVPRIKFFIIIIFSCIIKNSFLSAFPKSHNDFIWYDHKGAMTFSVSRSVSPVVHIALDMFKNDIIQVTGKSPLEESFPSAGIHIVQMDKDSNKIDILYKMGIPIKKLFGRKEAFYIGISNINQQKKMMVVGSDARGTAYGILELSRLAGVSPWVWWNDVTPIHKDTLSLPEGFSTLQSPSVEYRGIFLNDEDWSLQPWSWKTFEPSPIMGRIGAKTYKEIFKLLLRLRANMIWPGMHGITTSFYLVPGAKEMADSCGIVIGTSHCEPLMRSNVGEWKVAERGRYNYITNKASVQNYWKERLLEVGKYENFYTIGMRGIHDSGMEGVKTLDEQTNALQEVIYDQRGMLSQYVNKDVKKIPQVFIPYKEVLQIMENGLDVPDDVTLMWCDDNYGYMTRLSDAEQQRRSGGSGVYYHLSYWGQPHDFLWLSTVQPGLVYSEMKQAYDYNARKLWIVNVHDPKVAAYDLELFLDMAWNINSVTPSNLNSHQEKWLCREFGEDAGRKLLPAMLRFYHLCGIRKPEFMGWNQTELDKGKYTRGWSPVKNSDFSLTEFGDELDRYLASYDSIRQIVANVESKISPQRKDAYFAAIKYPVYSAAAMAVKMLEAQRARTIAKGNCDTLLWTRDIDLKVACAKSKEAYREIRKLTDYYNNEMARGKWKYSMCSNPRDLYVFYPPVIPVDLNEEESVKYKDMRKTYMPSPVENIGDSCIAYNACRYSKASGKVYPIQSLGHSMNAVSVTKNSTISFNFENVCEGRAVIRIALIPTQPVDKGDIRFKVSIDDKKPFIFSLKEPFRSETWKSNVLRGQSVKSFEQVMKKGQHILSITALDDHLLVDQWMIDFKPDRSFYVFPVEPDF